MFNDSSTHGSTITFRYSFYQKDPTKYFLSPGEALHTITESGTGLFYGKKYEINAVLKDSGRNITLTEVVPYSYSPTTNSQILGAAIGSSSVTLILSLSIFFYWSFFIMKKDDKLLPIMPNSEL